MHKRLILTTMMASVCLLASANGHARTRGIGLYPGRACENFAPTMVVDNTYRNVALHRAAIASSSIDYNLTAQLATDGIASVTKPTTLTVSTPDGTLDLRNKERVLDQNIHTSNFLKGEDTYIQMHWEGMQPQADSIAFNAKIAYYPDKATKGYSIEILGSDNGTKWERIYLDASKNLPGIATRQMVSSDPNKQTDVVRLPLRALLKRMPIGSFHQKYLRIHFRMAGCAYWEVSSMDFKRADRIVEVTPAWNFTSAWVADGSQEQWLKVDLGTKVTFDRVRLHWIEAPQQGKIQTSQDGHTWADAAQLMPTKKAIQDISCNGNARYVRLLLQKPGSTRRYALAEIEVMGRGGLTPKPAKVRGMEDGRYWLDGGNWQLCRAGDTQWIPATVPGTVLTSYANIGALPPTNFDNNLRQVSESFFNSDFNYRNTFTVPTEYKGKQVWLNFDGINWKAEISLNGILIGKIDGAFKRGKFNVTKYLRADENTLEVKVIHNAHPGIVKIKNEESTDLNGGALGADNPTFHASIGWDWITSTPGREVGIWNDVFLTANDGVSVADPMVTTELNTPDTLATMTPTVRVANSLNRAVDATIHGWIGEIKFKKRVHLNANTTQDISFLPTEYPQLRNRKMRLWWPNGMGEPYLYDAGYTVEMDGTSDSIRYKAGIRQVSYQTMDTALQIFFNGHRLDPKGGNWGFSETNLNYRGREYDAAVRYHRDMNFTMIRNWVGQIGDEEFYESCDKYGIVVWQDFWLANPWDGPDPYQENMFMDNANDYIYRIRQHASIGIYVGRNEGYPPATLDQALRKSIAKEHPQLGYISSSADDGVSGHGPYWAVPPDWYFAHTGEKLHSERGLPNIVSYESLKRMLAPEHLWPQSIAWAQHDFTQKGAQRGASFNEILATRFGQPQSAKTFTEQAQWINYDLHRAMYEAAQQTRQGMLMWMSHPCWPSMVWQTYDYYLEPTAAYFGIKKACEPLHVQLNAHTKNIEVVNTTLQAHQVEIVEEQFDIRGNKISTRNHRADVAEDQTVRVAELLSADLPIRLVRLTLKENGRKVTENFYIEARSEADYQALKALPEAKLQFSQHFEQQGDEMVGHMTAKNLSDVPAYYVRLNLKGNDGEQILPVLYEDNYFTLLPGEEKTVKVSFRVEDSH